MTISPHYCWCHHHNIMFFLFIILTILTSGEARQNDTETSREKKILSMFNVIKFPNTICEADSSFNGTCYTQSECSSLGGTASGTCAQSFGVCCVFSIGCGGQSSANNSYAIMSTYTTSSDPDPCTYTICKLSSDTCKIRSFSTILTVHSCIAWSCF